MPSSLCMATLTRRALVPQVRLIPYYMSPVVDLAMLSFALDPASIVSPTLPPTANGQPGAAYILFAPRIFKRIVGGVIRKERRRAGAKLR